MNPQTEEMVREFVLGLSPELDNVALAQLLQKKLKIQSVEGYSIDELLQKLRTNPNEQDVGEVRPIEHYLTADERRKHDRILTTLDQTFDPLELIAELDANDQRNQSTSR